MHARAASPLPYVVPEFDRRIYSRKPPAQPLKDYSCVIPGCAKTINSVVYNDPLATIRTFAIQLCYSLYRYTRFLCHTMRVRVGHDTHEPDVLHKRFSMVEFAI